MHSAFFYPTKREGRADQYFRRHHAVMASPRVSFRRRKTSAKVPGRRLEGTNVEQGQEILRVGAELHRCRRDEGRRRKVVAATGKGKGT